jgi:hypothetical protein
MDTAERSGADFDATTQTAEAAGKKGQLFAFPEDECELSPPGTLARADLTYIRQHRGDSLTCYLGPLLLSCLLCLNKRAIAKPQP